MSLKHNLSNLQDAYVFDNTNLMDWKEEHRHESTYLLLDRVPVWIGFLPKHLKGGYFVLVLVLKNSVEGGCSIMTLSFALNLQGGIRVSCYLSVSVPPSVYGDSLPTFQVMMIKLNAPEVWFPPFYNYCFLCSHHTVMLHS